MNRSPKILLVDDCAHSERTRCALVAILASSPEQVLVLGTGAPLSLPSDSSAALPDSFVWMPKGTHAINAHTVGGGTFSGKIICDEQACRAISESFAKITATGARVWLDFDHEDGEASAWVKGFSWDSSRGILAHVEWTAKGAEALRGKAYYSFSPAFSAERETGRIVSLLPGHAAGGLVNAPAFTAMPALIAARLATFPATHQPAPGGSTVAQSNMTKEEVLKLLAALKVTPPADASLEQLVALHAKTVAEVAAAEIQAKADAEAAAIKAKNAAAVEAEKKRIAEAAAVQAKAEADAKLAAELAEIKAAFAAIRAGASGGNAGPGLRSVKTNPFEAIKAMMKETDPKKRGQIYSADLREFVSVTAGLAEILAANSFGTVTSDLIILRCLDLLKYSFPILGAISTDFSDGVVALEGQSIKSRIVTVPTATVYDPSTGWGNSDATTVDVPVSIGVPVGVQIALNNSELGGTSRDLFAEQVEASHYALGKYMVDALYAIMTQANFNAGAQRTIKALASFARGDVIDMGTALSKRGVAGMGRFLLLNSDYYGAVSKDLVAVANSAMVGGETLKTRKIGQLHDFEVIEAPNLPANAFTSTTGNLQGFGGRKDSLVIATRVPNDYTKALPGASNGSVSVVTNPDTGISVQKVDFVDHKLGKAYSRIALSFGVAKGQTNSAQVLTQT